MFLYMPYECESKMPASGVHFDAQETAEHGDPTSNIMSDGSEQREDGEVEDGEIDDDMGNVGNERIIDSDRRLASPTVKSDNSSSRPSSDKKRKRKEKHHHHRHHRRRRRSSGQEAEDNTVSEGRKGAPKKAKSDHPKREPRAQEDPDYERDSDEAMMGIYAKPVAIESGFESRHSRGEEDRSVDYGSPSRNSARSWDSEQKNDRMGYSSQDEELEDDVKERDGFRDRRRRDQMRKMRNRGRKSGDYFQKKQRQFPRKDLEGKGRSGFIEKRQCKYFMEGRCGKAENCQFSHNFQPPKKLELCKFYAISTCLKGDNCVYLHNEFPCKFFHAGTRFCREEQQCKFSHDPLTQEKRALLQRFIEDKPFQLNDDDNFEVETFIHEDRQISLLGSPPRNVDMPPRMPFNQDNNMPPRMPFNQDNNMLPRMPFSQDDNMPPRMPFNQDDNMPPRMPFNQDDNMPPRMEMHPPGNQHPHMSGSALSPPMSGNNYYEPPMGMGGPGQGFPPNQGMSRMPNHMGPPQRPMFRMRGPPSQGGGPPQGFMPHRPPPMGGMRGPMRPPPNQFGGPMRHPPLQVNMPPHIMGGPPPMGRFPPPHFPPQQQHLHKQQQEYVNNQLDKIAEFVMTAKEASMQPATDEVRSSGTGPQEDNTVPGQMGTMQEKQGPGLPPQDKVPEGAYVPPSSGKGLLPLPNVRLGGSFGTQNDDQSLPKTASPQQTNTSESSTNPYLHLINVPSLSTQSSTPLSPDTQSSAPPNVTPGDSSKEVPWRLIPLEVPIKIPYPLMQLPGDIPHFLNDPRLRGHAGIIRPAKDPRLLRSDSQSESLTEQSDEAKTKEGPPVAMPTALLEKPPPLTEVKLDNSIVTISAVSPSPTSAPTEATFSISPQPRPFKLQLNEMANNFVDDSDANSLQQTSSSKGDRSYLADPRFRRRKVSSSPGSNTQTSTTNPLTIFMATHSPPDVLSVLPSTSSDNTNDSSSLEIS